MAVLIAAFLPGCVVVSSSSDGDGNGFVMLLVAAAVLLVVVAVARRGGARRRPPAQPGSTLPSLPMLRAELSVLADDVVTLEPRVALSEAARDDFAAATQRYRVAQVALDEAAADLDLVRLQRLVDEATWSMSRARAIVEGRKPPEPPATLQRPGGHGEPAIQLDEHERPSYVGVPVEFRSGWFGAGGGVFGGLLVGTVLGAFGGWVDHEAELDSDFTDDGGETEGW